MNLVSLRKQLREVSGRFDLVEEDGTDSGLDFYIEGAIKYLNTRGIVDKPIARLFFDVPAGVQVIPFNDEVRIVKEVWLRTSSSSQFRKLLNVKFMHHDLVDKTGNPVYYKPAYLQVIPTSYLFKDLSVLPDDVFSPSLKYNSIVLFPYPISDVQLEILVDHLHDSICNGTNYWIKEHPELLIMATMRQMEIFHRNTQGVNDWDRSVEEYILNLRQELVHEEALEYTRMEG